MNTFNILYLLFLPFVITEISQYGCKIVIDDSDYYDLSKLEKDDDYNIDVKIGSDDYSLDFNVCSYISKTCENTKDIYAALISKGTNESNTTCYALTKAKSDYKVHNIHTDEDEVEDYIELQYENGEECSFQEEGGSFTFSTRLICKQGHSPETYSIINEDPCKIIAVIESEEACGHAMLNAIWDFIDKYYYLFGVGMIILGILSILWGLKFFWISLFIFTGLAAALIFVTLIYKYAVPYFPSEWINWVTIVGGICVGVGAGFAAVKVIKIGIFCAGAWGGLCLGFLMYDAVLYKIGAYFDDTNIVILVILLIFAIVGGILALWLTEHALIVATSIFGAYMFARGVSLFAGGFPNEFLLMDRMKHKDIDGVENSFYIYLGVIFVFIALGIAFQEHLFKRSKNHGHHKQYRRLHQIINSIYSRKQNNNELYIY